MQTNTTIKLPPNSTKTLRAMADRVGFTLFRQGCGWVLSSDEQEQLPYHIVNEHDAYLFCLDRAADRGLLTEQEIATLAAR